MSETETTTANDDLAVGDLVDGFELEAWLGAGAVSNVWLARVPDARCDELRLERVAIKIMRLDRVAEASLRKRFMREARIGLRLSHENLVRAILQGQRKVGSTRQPYLVMEYHEGSTLRTVLQRESPLSESFAREVGLQLARALTTIHAAGLVHRDIKPANLLLTGAGVVKLLDLGVALDPTSFGKLTLPGFFVGTVTHAAPERLVAEIDDPASDLYAVGLVLYEMVTGGNPFHARTMHETMERHLKLQPPDPALVNPRVSAWFGSLIVRLLAKSPGRRYPSARALAQALADPTPRSTARFRRARGALGSAETRAPAPLIGRSKAVAQMRSVARQVVRGQRSCVFVHGPRGVGKSALVGELTAWSSAQSLHAGIHTGSVALPAALDRHRGLREAVLSVLAIEDEPGFGPAPAADVVTGKRFPALHAFVTGAGLAPPAAAVAAEIAQAVAERASSMPQVLVIDDAHRLTADAAELIAMVADAVVDAPVTFVVVGSDPVTRELEELRRRLAAEEVPVAAMPKGAVERYLLSRDVASTDARRMLAAIRDPELCHPGAAAVMASLMERWGWLERGRNDRLRLTALARLPRLPADLDQLCEARLRELEPGDRALIDAVGLASPWADSSLLAGALDRPPLDVARRLSGLEHRDGLVRSHGSRVELADRLLARFVDARLTGAARRQLHARIGNAWLPRGGRLPTGRLVVEAVRHLLAGDASEAALPHAAEAARFLIDSGASGDAVRLLALGRRVPAGGPATRLAEILEDLAEDTGVVAAERRLAREAARRYRG